MFKKFNAIKFLLTVLVFFGLLVSSEILYSLRNDHLNSVFNYYHLFFFKRNLEKNNCSKSLDHFFKLTDKIIKYRYKINPNQLSGDYSVFSYLNVQYSCDKSIFLFDSSAMNYLYRMDILDVNLSYIYYFSGIRAYKMGFTEIVPSLFQIAIYLNPDFSFYYLELANYYKLIGEDTKSIDQINLCMSFDYSRKHCEEYLYSLMNAPEHTSVGFQKESIDRYYREKNFLFY